MRRHAPEVVGGDDIEGGGGYGGGKTVSMAGGGGGHPLIQPFEGKGKPGSSRGRSGGSSPDKEFVQKVGLALGGVWLVGWLLLGWDMLWPVYMVQDLFGGVLSAFGSILNFPPFSWVSGWLYRGAPLVNHGQLMEEGQVSSAQVPQYIDNYVQQYGDAALIFASHDGYPQIVKGMLAQEDLGYMDLIDARDDSGNTALIYAAAKGFKQCTAALLRVGADPELPNQGGGGRTPLMEAAGGGFKEIVQAFRLTPKVNIDAMDDHGNTALHYAAYHGHLSVVMELLKGNPNKDIQNIYGHTPASYAASNKFKGVADAINRPESRTQRLAKQKELDDQDSSKAMEKQMEDEMAKFKAKKEAKHVKGKADLHEKDDEDFEPALERTDKVKNVVSEKEGKALQDQLAKAKKSHDEAELKSQKKIVDLLEKSSNQQKALDDIEEKHREYQMNHTELQLRISELESKHRSSQLREQDEADRANALQEKHRQAQAELEEHRRRSEAVERERDQHMQASKRHQEGIQRVQTEVDSHLTKLEQHQKESTLLREKLRRADEEKRRHQEQLEQLQRELGQLRPNGSAAASGGGGVSAAVPAAAEQPRADSEPPSAEPAKQS